MSNETEKTPIERFTSEFGPLISPIIGTPDYQRLQKFLREKTNGEPFQVYLAGPASDTEKHAIIDEAIGFVRGTVAEARAQGLHPTEAENEEAPAQAATAKPEIKARAKTEPTSADEDTLALAEALKRLTRRRENEAESEATIRRIVREELRTVLSQIVEDLESDE